MSTRVDPRVAVSVPEPNLTPDEMIARATALQPLLRAEQDATEKRGVHSEALHHGFRKAGFYRCLQPRRFGGYEFDLKTFYRLAIELSRGDPSTGWCVTLGAGHALMLGVYFSAEAQADGFGPDGNFSGPSVAAPNGTATPADGGWLIKGKWGYASGAPYATHFLPTVLITDSGSGEAPGPPRAGIALIPRAQWTMLDDWGAILGMRGSGSNSIVVEGARLPKTTSFRSTCSTPTSPTALSARGFTAIRCTRAGAFRFFAPSSMRSWSDSATRRFDEYEHLTRTKNTLYPPIQPRYTHPDYQRYVGLALGLLNAAKRLVLNSADVYMGYCRRGFEGGKPFTLEEDLRTRRQFAARRAPFVGSDRDDVSHVRLERRKRRRAHAALLPRRVDLPRSSVVAIRECAHYLGLVHLGLVPGVSTMERGAVPPAAAEEVEAPVHGLTVSALPKNLRYRRWPSRGNSRISELASESWM